MQLQYYHCKDCQGGSDQIRSDQIRSDCEASCPSLISSPLSLLHDPGLGTLILYQLNPNVKAHAQLIDNLKTPREISSDPLGAFGGVLFQNYVFRVLPLGLLTQSKILQAETGQSQKVQQQSSSPIAVTGSQPAHPKSKPFAIANNPRRAH